MRQKLVTLVLAVAVIVSLVVVGCAKPAQTPTPAPTPAPAPSPAPAPAEKFNLKMTSTFPEQSPIFQNVEKLVIDAITEKSNGRITFTVYGASVLGSGPEQYYLIKIGVADIGVPATGYTPGRFPLTDVFTLPGAFITSKATADMVLAVGERILYKEFTDTQPLAFMRAQDFYIYTSDKPVKVLEDLKGLKLRSSGGIITPTIEALGATPVFLDMSDVYLSLETGMIDGAVLGPSAIPTFKLEDQFNHVTKIQLGSSAHVLAINLDTWEKLPEDLKKAVKEGAQGVGYGQPAMLAASDQAVTKIFLDRGGTVTTLSPEEKARWINALKPVVDNWEADLVSKGLPGKELMDIVREECQKRNVSFPY